MPLAYTDLDYYLSSANIQAVNDLINVLDGTGCLRIDRAGGASSEVCNAAPKVATTQGVARGVLRVRVAIDTLPSASQYVGLCCMQSQRDLTSGGSGYLLAWHAASGVLRLRKMTSGLANAGGITILRTGAASGSDVTLQLTWSLAADQSALMLAGAVDEVVKVSYTDTSPLTAHVAEGLFYNDGGAGADFAVRLDTMTLRGA